MTTATSFEGFLTALPKVELHVHLEGSMQPDTLLSLADKHRISDLQRSLTEIRSWYEFRDFGHFRLFGVKLGALGRVWSGDTPGELRR